MHSSRVATFLLGAWLGCCLLMDAIAVQNLRLAERFMSSPIIQVTALTNILGPQQTTTLLRHFVSEQNRFYFANWELVEIPAALVTIAFVYFACEKRITPLVLAALMLVMVVFQAFAITPEWGYRGREVDFPPGSDNIGQQARLWAMTQIFMGVEATKIFIGLILTTYIFLFKSRKRVRSSERLSETERVEKRG
jgi:hypothetical protein